MKRSFLAVLICILATAVSAAETHTGLSLLSLSAPNAAGLSEGVATFNGQMPSGEQLNAMRALGLRVQGMSRLPLALLVGPREAMVSAVHQGLAADVYPNERLQYYSTASNATMRANEVHALGVDGSGVLVAIVDSGIDATHPDLAKRVTYNVKMIPNDSPAGDIIIPFYLTPYNNSDTSSGHGTHVAGIVAADNTDGKMIGTAPGANLVGYGMGDAIFVFDAIAAFDDIMRNLDSRPVRVVNNSWGSSFRLFDPEEPINVASKVMHDAGITVVFAAGNQSEEMSINPYSVAPWVIGVAAGTYSHQRAQFSSAGIEYDNSVVGNLPAGEEKHVTFSGDRIGLYHPSVTAPGDAIVSTATTGATVTSTPGGTASADGTSMAAPHVAGVAALLLQRRPNLTPDEIKSVLQVTASLMPSNADTTKVQPFWQNGYGYVDAKAAIDLVSRQRYNKEKALARLQQETDKRVLGDRDYSLVNTNYWTFTAAAATVDGTPDNRTYTIEVPTTTKAIKAVVAYPSLGYVGVNAFDYRITITDAAGTVVGQSTPSASAGVSQLFADLTQGSYAYGTWTVNVRGDLGAQDQDIIMGYLVSLAVSQLAPQTRVSPALPVFTATGTTPYYFQPGTAGALTSPEGCNQQVGAPVGGLATARGTGPCQSGNMGYAVNYGAGVPGVFTSARLTAPLTVGGQASVKFYLVDPLQPAWDAASNPRLTVEVDAVDDNGEMVMAVGSAEWTVCNESGCNVGPQPVGGTYTFQIAPATIPAGTRLSVIVRESAAVSSTTRTVYGGTGLGGTYSDAGVTLTTGTMQ